MASNFSLLNPPFFKRKKPRYILAMWPWRVFPKENQHIEEAIQKDLEEGPVPEVQSKLHHGIQPLPPAEQFLPSLQQFKTEDLMPDWEKRKKIRRTLKERRGFENFSERNRVSETFLQPTKAQLNDYYNSVRLELKQFVNKVWEKMKKANPNGQLCDLPNPISEWASKKLFESVYGELEMMLQLRLYTGGPWNYEYQRPPQEHSQIMKRYYSRKMNSEGPGDVRSLLRAAYLTDIPPRFAKISCYQSKSDASYSVINKTHDQLQNLGLISKWEYGTKGTEDNPFKE